MTAMNRTDTQSSALHVADRHDLIRVHGARVNNLKDLSVEIPKRRLTVFTGVSGSGKSSLVFDTNVAESLRMINETYSAFMQGFMPTLGVRQLTTRATSPSTYRSRCELLVPPLNPH
jgi:excinuclease UvrABC ATPase subunit